MRCATLPSAAAGWRTAISETETLEADPITTFSPRFRKRKALHRRALEGEALRADEDCFVRADGTVQWLRWDVRPWYAADAIGGIVIFTEDITEKKRAEEALRASELRFPHNDLGDSEPFVRNRCGWRQHLHQRPVARIHRCDGGEAPGRALSEPIIQT